MRPCSFFCNAEEDFDLGGVENACGRRFIAACGASQHELHRNSGADERNDGELFERHAILDDALLDAQPLALRVRNSCSICQRRRYQPITVSAGATLSTACVVNKRQWIGSSPPGG